MPTITITVSAALIAKVQEFTDAHNAATKESLTAELWVKLQLKEKAVAEEQRLWFRQQMLDQEQQIEQMQNQLNLDAETNKQALMEAME